MNKIDELEPNKVTLCIVNYKTEELTRLCLRSIRKFTRYPHEVVVVDNNSGDKSLDYLRSLSWIRLIERPGVSFKSGSMAQGTALDLGLESCTTQYFLAMHSDTFIHKKGWLEWQVKQMEKSPKIVCTGSGKLDLKPAFQVFMKRITDYKAWVRRMKTVNPLELDFYIRAICALYDTKTLLEENLTFSMSVEDGMTCAKQMYFELLQRGYETRVISEFEMADKIHHLAHATMVFNPEFQVRDRTLKKCKAKLEKLMASPLFQEIQNDHSLDK